MKLAISATGEGRGMGGVTMEKYPDSEVTKAYNQLVAKIMEEG